LIFFFSGDSGIPDLHFSLEKKQKRRWRNKKETKKKKGQKNKLRQSALHICVFQVSNKCSLAETRKGRQKWTDALLEAIWFLDVRHVVPISPYLFLCLSIFPHIAFSFSFVFLDCCFFPHNIVYFQFSNECMPLDSL
jgi:hypothetical protein